MLFIKDIRSSFTLCQKPWGLTTYSLFFIIADTTRDLLIMHACDTFYDQLILLHMLFQFAVITLLYCIYYPASFHEIFTGTNF